MKWMTKREAKRRFDDRINGALEPVTTFQDDLNPVHYCKAEGLTIYQILTHQGCTISGAPKWCTTSKKSTSALSYLMTGKLYLLHIYGERFQIFVRDDDWSPRTIYEIRNDQNEHIYPAGLVGRCRSLADVFDMTRCGRYLHPSWSKERLLKVMPILKPSERLLHMKGILGYELEDHPQEGIKLATSDTWVFRAQDYLSAAYRLSRADLVQFCDDPYDEIRALLARHLEPWEIPAQLLDDPSVYVRTIARARTRHLNPKKIDTREKIPSNQFSFAFSEELSRKGK